MGKVGEVQKRSRRTLNPCKWTLDVTLKVTKTLKGFKQVSDMIIFELQKDPFVAERKMD